MKILTLHGAMVGMIPNHWNIIVRVFIVFYDIKEKKKKKKINTSNNENIYIKILKLKKKLYN